MVPDRINIYLPFYSFQSSDISVCGAKSLFHKIEEPPRNSPKCPILAISNYNLGFFIFKHAEYFSNNKKDQRVFDKPIAASLFLLKSQVVKDCFLATLTKIIPFC